MKPGSELAGCITIGGGARTNEENKKEAERRQTLFPNRFAFRHSARFAKSVRLSAFHCGSRAFHETMIRRYAVFAGLTRDLATRMNSSVASADS
jgi:hypothetical protein